MTIPCLTDFVSDSALRALTFEANVTPKPGLVDRNNVGAHPDMTLDMLIKSAEAISPYIGKCAQSGFSTRNLPPEIAFESLKTIGLQAERAMFQATNGTNTHKGAIFCFCLLSGAYGRLIETKSVTPESICETASRLSEKAMRFSLTNAKNNPLTHGDAAYRLKSISGARGEALTGYPSLLNIALPAFAHAKQMGFPLNDAGVYTLLSLIANVDDTCIYTRGGSEGIALAQSLAAKALSSGFMTEAENMDSIFIKKRLSPGGCADLLAAAMFIKILTSTEREEYTCE